jgi:hypothetical protein
MNGLYNIYAGPSPEAIDYDTPIGFAALGAESAAVSVLLQPGERQFFAARRVSSAGIEEQGSQAIACAEVDEAGNLLPPPLPTAYDLVAGAGADLTVRLGFSFHVPPGFAVPECLEILTDQRTGSLDNASPAAALSVIDPGPRDYQVALPCPLLPVRLAVRGRAGSRRGPLVQIAVNARLP